MEPVVESLKKTHKALIVEEDTKTGGAGAEIMAQIMEQGFDYLDGPVVRLAGADVPMPKSSVLEALAIPSKASIIEAVKKML